MRRRRWLVVSLGSPLLAAAPTGELNRCRTLRGATAKAWEFKHWTGYMEFGVADRRSGLVVWTTDGSHKDRSEDERRLFTPESGAVCQ